MRRVWLIRAGENAEQIDAMRHAGLIGVRFETVGDVRELSIPEIEQEIAEAGHGVVVTTQRAILVQFAKEARPGDLVVSPNVARREVWLGVIRGEYQYSEQPRIAGYAHTREVEWLGWLDRDAAWMRDQLKSIDRPLVMYELPGREWWWRQADTREFGSAPRPVREAPATRSRAAAGTGAPRAPRAPRAPAAKPVSTRKPPVALVRCAGSCGYQWAPTSLVDGLCADCRGD